MELTRRSFLAGLGSVSVGLLFRRKLEAVLDSLEQDLVAEQQAKDQAPSAAEIVVSPAVAFRAERLVVAPDLAPLFTIEDICVGATPQLAPDAPIPADMFLANPTCAAVTFDVVSPGAEIRFRVRYVGPDPRGARFVAMLVGTAGDEVARRVLPIDSICRIVG